MTEPELTHSHAAKAFDFVHLLRIQQLYPDIAPDLIYFIVMYYGKHTNFKITKIQSGLIEFVGDTINYSLEISRLSRLKRRQPLDYMPPKSDVEDTVFYTFNVLDDKGLHCGQGCSLDNLYHKYSVGKSNIMSEF